MSLAERTAMEVERWRKMREKGLGMAEGRAEAARLFHEWVAYVVKVRDGEEPTPDARGVFLRRLKDAFDAMQNLCVERESGDFYLAGSVECVHLLRYFVREDS